MRPKSEYYSLKSHKLWKTYTFTCNQKQVLCDAVPEYVSKVFTSPLSSIYPQFSPLKTELINQKQIFNFLYYLLLSPTFTNLSTGCVLLCAFKHNGERGLVDLCCCFMAIFPYTVHLNLIKVAFYYFFPWYSKAVHQSDSLSCQCWSLLQCVQRHNMKLMQRLLVDPLNVIRVESSLHLFQPHVLSCHFSTTFLCC